MLTAIFGVLRAACAFNSTGLDTSGAANATVPQPLVSVAATLPAGARKERLALRLFMLDPYACT